MSPKLRQIPRDSSDPHPVRINGERYLTLNNQPDLGVKIDWLRLEPHEVNEGIKQSG